MAKVIKKFEGYVIEIDEFVGQIAKDSVTMYPLIALRGTVRVDGKNKAVKTLLSPYARPHSVYNRAYVISVDGMPDELWIGFYNLYEVQINLATLWPMNKVKAINEYEMMCSLESMFEGMESE